MLDARRGGSGVEVSGYKTAAICLSGHVATSDVEISPVKAGKFCKECGQEVVTTCPSCPAPIRGAYVGSGTFFNRKYTPPNYCEDCGKPFPWMAAKLKAATELADQLENVSEAERCTIKESFGEIASDTPATAPAAFRLKKLLGKATDAVGQALWKAAVDIGTEAAKKGLLG